MARPRKVHSSKLTTHIGYWMRLVSNQVSHAFARKLEASGVTVAEWVILREMYNGEATTSPGSIAAITGLTRGAVSKLITRLLEKGFVHRQESTDDRRFQEIKISAKASSLVPQLASIADENDEEFFACLTKVERSELKRVLQKMSEYHHLKTVPTE